MHAFYAQGTAGWRDTPVGRRAASGGLAAGPAAGLIRRGVLSRAFSAGGPATTGRKNFAVLSLKFFSRSAVLSVTAANRLLSLNAAA